MSQAAPRLPDPDSAPPLAPILRHPAADAPAREAPASQPQAGDALPAEAPAGAAHAPDTSDTDASLRARGWAPTMEHVWLGLVVVAASLACAVDPLDPIDYWWSVRLGSLIRQLGAIPTDDSLVYTVVRGPIVDGQWLARVVISALHDLGGVDLTLALRTVIAVTAALLLARMCRTAGAGARVSAVMAGLSVILFVPGLAVRPQLMAVLPFLLVMRAALDPPRSVLGVTAMAAVVVFWANAHGSFILIYPLLGVGMLEALVERLQTGSNERLKRALILSAVCGLAPLVNPYGIGLASYVGDAILFNGGGTSIGVLGSEWTPPELKSAYGGLFYGSVVLAVVLLGAGTRPRLGEGLLLLAFGLLAVSSTRHILWWSLVAVPFIARGFAELFASGPFRRVPQPGPLPVGSPSMNRLCLLAFGMMAVVALPWWRERLPLPPDRTVKLDVTTPVAVGEYLATHPKDGRLFNDTDWSAYLTWRLPDTQVFVDNRFELHPSQVWEEYLTVSRGHVSWQRRLDAHGVTRLALNRAGQSGLIAAVRESPDWQLVYEDKQALVFDRVTPVGAVSSTP
ncbi:MAG: hypothetical protein U0893_18490 [Chloroflexota bacterium]